MSLPVGELFMLGFRGREIPSWLREFAARFGLGGVILFDYDCIDRRYERNVASPEQVRALCRELHELPSRPLVYVDQEGGKVRRLKERYGFRPIPSAKQMGLSQNREWEPLLREAFVEMRDLGIDVNLAPVVDIDYNPANPDLGAVERCFSASPDVVERCARTYLEAGAQTGLKLVLKHYPGCGGATVNSHEELMSLESALHAEQLDLFDRLLGQNPFVLLSHGVVPQWEPKVPVSLSRVAVERIRRRTPHALLFTDDLQMEGLQRICSTGEAIVRAVRAGVDVLCIGNNLRDEQESCFEWAETLTDDATRDPKLLHNLESALARLRKFKT